MESNTREIVRKLLKNEFPPRFIFGPNYWQWFAHHLNHGILPHEIRNCRTQLDMINHLGVDAFSRNVYCRQDEVWIGGICEEYVECGEIRITNEYEGKNKIINREYVFPGGRLSEKQMYVFDESTIVQKDFLITDYNLQADLFEKLTGARKWKFNPQKYEQICSEVGERGLVMVGDLFSPLKNLHFTMGAVNAVYFLLEHPEFSKRIIDLHEESMLDLARQCVTYGVPVIMSMDNLDTVFHPPDFVEAYSASFYEKASAICHSNDAKFFIHACGNQRENLKLISSLKVDGLEGFAYPPLGNISIEEGMKMTHDKFIIFGGVSAMETMNLTTRKEIFDYIRNLFVQMKPFQNRFVLASSCNTAINTSWDTIKNFRDAWLEYREM